MEKYKSKDFIVYKFDSGEMNFTRRSDIASFMPIYTHPIGYRICCNLKGGGNTTLHKTETLEEAELWCLEQIRIMEEGTPEQKLANDFEVAKKKAND